MNFNSNNLIGKYMKIIKTLFISNLILNSFLLEKRVLATNTSCNYILEFKKNESLIKNKSSEEYIKFEKAHNFLNQIVLHYDFFDSNNFLIRKYREYVFRSVFATSKISRIKELVESKPLDFLKNKEFKDLNKALIEEINYFKLNYEKIQIADQLNTALSDLHILKQERDNLNIKDISNPEFKKISEKIESINSKIENLNIQFDRPLNIEAQLVVNNFSYNINGEFKSYKDIPKISDRNTLFSLLDNIYSDLKIAIVKNISNLTDYELNERVKFLNKTKTFSFAEFKSSSNEISLYYSISGQNFYFKKPTPQMRNNLLTKINSNEYTYTKEKMKNRLEVMDTLLNNDIKLVSQIDSHKLPAINTDKKVLNLTEDNVKNSVEYDIYKNLPLNSGKSENEIISDFIGLKNNHELGLKTIDAFKNGNEVLDSKARKYDSEYKLLNHFLSDTENNSNLQGELVVYTSKPACNSCITGYESFKDRRPNVKLKVVALSSGLEVEMKETYLQKHGIKID